MMHVQMPPIVEEPPGADTQRLAELALWLTQDEADVLVALCLTSPGDGGEVEASLFRKLGSFIRTFHLGAA